MKTRLFYCDHHEFPLPPEHRFPIGKYRLTRELLTQDSQWEIAPAQLVSREVVERVHDREYVERFLCGTLEAHTIRRIGFPWSEGLVRRTLASVGGTVAAAHDALEHGLGCNLAGGTHHAFKSEGAGYCVFNDIAIAVMEARTRRPALRAAIVDCDVHQGDGTAHIFADDPSVFTLSIHGRKNFPFRKQKSRVDVELEDGTRDAEYLLALESALKQVWSWRPDIVFYQSGVDALACDLLGRLALSHEGLILRDRLVLEPCAQRGVPVVITLGGGYGNPIEQTALAHANVYRTALAVFNGTQ
jgi:acetoin utilization deacetylase AcuC-like enzyme